MTTAIVAYCGVMFLVFLLCFYVLFTGLEAMFRKNNPYAKRRAPLMALAAAVLATVWAVHKLLSFIARNL